MNRLSAFHYLSPFLVFSMLLLASASSGGKEAPVSDALTLDAAPNFLSVDSSSPEFIPVILVLKSQPISQSKEEVLPEHEALISGYESEINIIMGKSSEQ